MAGLDLSAERSGKASDTAYPVISKKGRPIYRYALYQAAFIASTGIRNSSDIMPGNWRDGKGERDQPKEKSSWPQNSWSLPGRS